MAKKPIAWTIAGSDSGGGAGIQADLHTFHAFQVHGCSVITALTAQNSHAVTQVQFTSGTMLSAQINALNDDLPPAAIKTGMLGNRETMQALAEALPMLRCPLVCDPVMVASSGARLFAADDMAFIKDAIFPWATVITPNLPETAALLDVPITELDIPKAAQRILALGAKSVLIKGGHATQELAQDYWTNGEQAFWLSSPRHASPHTHGSGCSLASALAACLALGYPFTDALVIAKAYVQRAIQLATAYGKGPGPVVHTAWPSADLQLPNITISNPQANHHLAFPGLGPQALGFYPIVDNSQLLEQLLKLGVGTIQLRIKHLQGQTLEQEIQRASQLGRDYNAKVFINDYWDLALRYQAYGVHLGQEDLATADLDAMAKAEMRLGISTHNYWEAARAQACKPSYIAVGPIYDTTTKAMAYPAQGLQRLQHFCQLLDCPVVAIGGIKLPYVHQILATGASGIAVISALTQAPDIEAAVKQWQTAFDTFERQI